MSHMPLSQEDWTRKKLNKPDDRNQKGRILGETTDQFFLGAGMRV